eukprot:CAMPEP_0181195598 /NCGR_PEP_ID=MMETSP1096-20121128/14979_1 /TAXON_ID=156174 ORGANISM="Chrysochromulina ericina, Strain CCMP281" /NCGR_SAMPLE_ID=MMETSP1096 /ASSEMBLY_ACC=CAM_ASM_000453 /LENGTH=44 /DNA_ID= /DNA_START= /DNA_END= /DNA_ORIENTATION=
MGSAWDLHGICMGSAWDLHGIRDELEPLTLGSKHPLSFELIITV